ncbi:MAG: MMPL family transporter [Methylovulum sp.]|nr:MMPL family transporter [Methylovulum sp.]
MSSKSRTHNLLARWGSWSLNHPVVLLSIAGLLIFSAWQYTAANLSINTDTTELVAPDAPFQQNRRHFEKEFPQDMRTILLVLESETPELTRAATTRLSRLLNTDRDNFDSVYTPNDNAFFRRNGLLYLDLDDLQNLSATMSEAQPFIGRISQETHLGGFFSILDDALTSSDGNTDLPIDLPSLINKVSAALHTSVNNGDALLSWEELIASKKIAAKSSFIIVRPKLDYTQIRPAKNAIDVMRKAVNDIQEPGLPAVKVWITGEVGLEDDELSGMSTGTFTASLFSVVLVLGILLLAYRSVFLTLATLITLALGMILCGAFAALAVKELNLISVAFAVSNIGLGVEYAIHFCLRYRDNLGHHLGRDKAIRGTLISTSPSLLLCAGTTAIGLYAFIPTDYKGVSELGLLAGTSLFICLFVTLTVLPVLLKIIPVQLSHLPVAQETGFIRLPEKLAGFTLHFAKPITIVVGILALISSVLVTDVQTDFNPVNLRDPNTDSVIAFKHLIKDKDNTPMTLTVLAKDENAAKALQKKLGSLASVDKTVSFFDFLPADQDEKLAVIEEMALTLGLNLKKFPALKSDYDPVDSIQHLIKTIDQVLPKQTDAKEINILTGFKAELQGMLVELDTRQQTSRRLFLDKVQSTLLGTLPGVMNDLLTGLDARGLVLNDIPADIRERWLSKDGWYRIQIYAKKDLNDLTNLEAFITDVQSVAPETTDLPIMYWESMKAVVGAFEQAITIALITIALVLYGIRRNITDTLLIMTPLMLAGLFTMASTVITHTPINFANIIALPLLLGFGVDNGIHMVEKLRHSLSEKQNIYQSSTARAMFYGALTTSSSFAGLAFSPHQGIASMGLVITIGIFWIMTSTFVILPALSKLVLKPQATPV